jgi:hypothetical protein
MSPALALVVGALAAALVLTAGLLAWAIRDWRRAARARKRSRLTGELHLLGHEPHWARRTLNDIHHLPTTQGDR